MVVYGVAQQAARRAVDDVPRAMLEQARGRLSAGVTPTAAVGGPTVDLSTSDAPFLLVSDRDRTLVASSTTIGGDVPNLPPGLLDAAVARGVDRVSWQPQAGVREAVVAAPWRADRAGVRGRGCEPRAHRDRTGVLGRRVGIVWLLTELALTAAVGGAVVRRRRTSTRADDPCEDLP